MSRSIYLLMYLYICFESKEIAKSYVFIQAAFIAAHGWYREP